MSTSATRATDQRSGGSSAHGSVLLTPKYILEALGLRLVAWVEGSTCGDRSPRAFRTRAQVAQAACCRNDEECLSGAQSMSGTFLPSTSSFFQSMDTCLRCSASTNCFVSQKTVDKLSEERYPRQIFLLWPLHEMIGAKLMTLTHRRGLRASGAPLAQTPPASRRLPALGNIPISFLHRFTVCPPPHLHSGGQQDGQEHDKLFLAVPAPSLLTIIFLCTLYMQVVASLSFRRRAVTLSALGSLRSY